MPVAFTEDEGEVLCVVVLFLNKVIEHHQAIHLPHLGNVVRQVGADLGYLCVVDAWEAEIRPNKSIYTNDVQFALWRTGSKRSSPKYLPSKRRVSGISVPHFLARSE